MLALLLDIVKVPESHTGMALAKAFQRMLETFGLQEQVMFIVYCYTFKLITCADSCDEC
jgi:hypothetical protein